uniref:Uncharacterized protein n=1 Tax=Coccidioides posadasii RMSCC 3488 TaxID=454284 RepID=A0A0J6FPS2_COCPO|nr:hypothetical protein CPAG_08677 [Coccidioides posadasii RMSCC 3488]
MEELCGNKGAVQTECNEMITEGCLYILLSRTSLADGRAGLSIIPFVLDEFLCRWLRGRCINHIHAERNIPAGWNRGDRRALASPQEWAFQERIDHKFGSILAVAPRGLFRK